MARDIPIDSPFLGRHDFVRADGESFWEFLERHDIEYQKSHFPFLTNSRVPRVRKIFNFDEYVQLKSRGEALAYLYDGLGRSLNYVGPVLDQELKHGFNDHTDRHTLWVSQTGVELLQRAGYSFDGGSHYGAQTEVLMTLVGMMHDLGNFMDRKQHSTYSAWLMDRLFVHTDKHPKIWDAVLYSVLFHEEPVLVEMEASLGAGMPLQWGLVAADKMHVGRDRIGGRSFESGIKHGAFEEDEHIILESLIVRSAWYMASGTFVWHLGFSVDQLDEKFASFTKGNNRLWVPQIFQRMFERGVKYRDTFVKRFRRVYGARLRMLAESVFLLFPYIDEVQVLLADIDTRDKVGSGEKVVWKMQRKELKDVLKEKEVGEKRWWMEG